MRSVEIGGWFGAVLDVDGNLYTWGTNSNGELGLGDFEVREKPVLV